MTDIPLRPRKKASLWDKHKIFETNSIILIIGVLIMISIGGIVEIAPLFYLRSTIERVEGVRPYTPLELAGREIYVREGCYNCHSQMVRPLRDEIERYGHYSLAAESMYDKPFQWGSKRTGPDLARVGGKYSDEWHLQHLIDPRSLVPQSIMPGYPFLAKQDLDFRLIAGHLRSNAIGGVPYTEAMIANAEADLRAQATPDDAGMADLEARYTEQPEIAADGTPVLNADGMPKMKKIGILAMRDFDGDPTRITEADALIAYLQVIGTMVDFSLYDNKANLR
jgi:cytochrome c oxidase cbb3-type subunit 2